MSEPLALLPLLDRAGAALRSLLGLGPGGTIIWLGRWTAAAAALLALVALWTFFCYLREGRPSVPGRLALTLIRVAAAATLLSLLLEPTLRTEKVQRNRSVVAVLVDRSDSMALRDRWTDLAARRRLARWAGVADPAAFPRSEWARRAIVSDQTGSARRTAWLRRVAASHELRLFAFAGDRRPIRAADLQARSRLPGDTTRVGAAIGATLDEFSGQPLAGIIVLSDGGSNGGEDPVAAAGRAGERHVPVFTVGIGDPTPPRDLAVASLLVDDVVRKGDQVPVFVGLKHSGFTGPRPTGGGSPARPGKTITVRVTLREDGREVASQTVSLSPTGEQELQFTYRPRQTGAHTLQVSAAGLPSEVTYDNNTRKARVRVVEKRLRILYVEGSPRWEYRYLKNAILRDPSIKLACLLMDSEPSGGGEGNLKIPGFPPDRKQLFEYDIVILGDVARASLSDAQLALLRSFVEDRGGSLVVMAGEAHMPWEYRGTALEAVLPAAVPAGRPGATADEPFALKLTDAGSRHPMMQLEDDPAANVQRWQTLPGGYWHGVVGQVKPGATVLLEAARTRTDRSGQLSPQRPTPNTQHPTPLLLIQPAGEGTALLSLVDSTWRWRYRLGDTYFYRFWGQVLRTLTPHELPGDNRLVRLTVDRESYRPGEPVVLRARLLTPTYHPYQAASVPVALTRDDGTRTQIALKPLSGSPGVFTADWSPPRPGKYQVVLRAPSGGATAEAGFAVEGAPLELQEPEMNRELLARVAQASGGAYLELEQLDQLPRRIPDRSETLVTRSERPLWDTPWPLALFSLLLVGEWVLRKRSGLL